MTALAAGRRIAVTAGTIDRSKNERADADREAGQDVAFEQVFDERRRDFLIGRLSSSIG